MKLIFSLKPTHFLYLTLLLYLLPFLHSKSSDFRPYIVMAQDSEDSLPYEVPPFQNPRISNVFLNRPMAKVLPITRMMSVSRNCEPKSPLIPICLTKSRTYCWRWRRSFRLCRAYPVVSGSENPQTSP